MATRICPVCQADAEEAARIRTIAICGACGASLVVEPDGTARAAAGADTTALDVLELQELRRARGAIARKDRTR